MKELYFGDCLDILKELYEKYPNGFIDLIYIDPPFNSKRDYSVIFEPPVSTDTKAQKEAFSDTWSGVKYYDSMNELLELNQMELYKFLQFMDNLDRSATAYLTTMAHRIFYMHKLLKDTGSFFLHCDPTMSHYLKIVCDLIFEKKNFRNEVVWHYRRWTNVQRQFQKMHDIILFYSKSHNNQFNVLKAEVSESQKKKYARGFDQNVIHTGIDSYKQLIVYDWEKVNKAKIDLSKFTKIIEKDKPDVNHSDVIILPVINSQAKERLGYPTQKPEILLEMLVSATTNEGDVVADFFCGCGTTIAVAERLNRQWLGVDISHLAIRLIKDRLIKPYPEEKRNEILANINIHGYPRDIASAKELSLVKNGRFMFQDWVVEILLDGVTNVKKSGDKGIDGYLTFKKSEKEKGIVIIEVKSGKFKHQDLAYLFESVKKHNADMGVFVCFDEFLTDGMKAEAKRQGNYMNYHIDKIQVLTIEELLAGKNVKLPGGAESSTFKAATKRLDTESNNNHVLFD